MGGGRCMGFRSPRHWLARCLMAVPAALAGCLALPDVPPPSSPPSSPPEAKPAPIQPCAATEAALELSLEEAIALGLRNNPRVSEAAAQIAAARAGADAAFAPFLPEVGTSFRYSAFTDPVIPGGSFVPASLSGGDESFSVAEAGTRWTLYDFGRTAGRYGQAI